MNILLIEPDAALAQTYRAFLELDNHQVRTVTTAQAGIHAVDTRRPDLILLELQLVSHSGIEFLYELRSYSEWQDLAVVVMSLVPPAEFNVSSDMLYRELGVSGYYYKPQISLQRLQQIVRQSQPVGL